MKNLHEIVQIVSSIRIKASDLLIIDKAQKNKSDELYAKILNGELKSDEEAADYFYGGTSSDSSYKNLKHHLRKRLISTLYFIDPQKAHSDYERAYLYCCKNMFAAKILLFLQARNAGINLCHRVFSKATSYDLTDFVLDSSRYLRLHYGSRLGNSKRFEFYSTAFKKYLQIWEAENLAEEYFALLMLPNIQKKSKSETETPEKAKTYYEKLKPYMEKYDSPFLQFLGNYINVIYLMSINDYHGTITVCKQAIEIIEAKSYSYKTPLRVFYHNQLICYTQLKAYEKGKAVALRSMELVRPGTYNWYVNKELFLVLALHSREYQEGVNVLYEAMNYYKFKGLPMHVKERWRIYEAYIHFLKFIGKVEIEDEKAVKFRMGKFLNSIPTFSKDKRGLNIPILIVQILFMVVKKDYDQSIDRFDAIEKYCSRYLRKNESFRSNCFIKMLLQIPISNFHKAAVVRKTEKYLKQLKSVPLEIANQLYEIEIIPYEDLWEMVIDSLEMAIYKTRNRSL